MNPEMADIRKEWDWVKKGIEKIQEQFHWLDYRPEDVYASCVNGNSILYKTEDGFTVFTAEIHPLTGEKSFLCWIAWARGRKIGLIQRHFDFFCYEAKKAGCSRISVKTPIDGIEKMLTDTGWRCDMRDFSFNLKEEV